MTITHQFPQAITTSLLPMALPYWSTVTWREPTVEEREAGRGWFMSTWHDLVLPAHKDWKKRTVTTKYIVLCGNLFFKMIIIAILLMILHGITVLFD